MGKRKVSATSDEPLVVTVLKQAQRSDVVRLRSNWLSEENQDHIQKYVAEKCSDIKIFKLQGAIGHRGLQRFAPALTASCETLRHLSLKANDLKVPAILDLVYLLQLPKNTVLEVLDISSNPFGNDGFKVVMENLVLNTSLKALLCSRCGVTDKGIRHTQGYFKSKRRPRTAEGGESSFYVNLAQNRVGPEGHCMLTRSIAPWMSLSLTHQRAPFEDDEDGVAAARVGAPQAAAQQAAEREKKKRVVKKKKPPTGQRRTPAMVLAGAKRKHQAGKRVRLVQRKVAGRPLVALLPRLKRKLFAPNLDQQPNGNPTGAPNEDDADSLVEL